MPGRRGIVVLLFIGALLASGLVPSPVSAAVLAVSTFDSGTEGWTAVTVDSAGNATPSTVSFADGAGNPGGAVRHNAPSESRTSYLVAPAAFVTALRSAQGGSVSWDISTLSGTNGLFFSDVDIDIRAGTTHLRRNVTPPAPPISPAYVRYHLAFGTGAGWLFFDGASTSPASATQIDAVLAGAESLRIRAEYWSSATPDTTFLDNVVVAGSGLGVVLDRATIVPGQDVDLRVLGNPPPAGPVDLYVVAALPPSLAPVLGCGNGLPLVFFTDGGTRFTAACASASPSTFPRYAASTTLSATATLLGLVWPVEAPPGEYIFAAVVTPPAALADGVLDPGDILAAPTAVLTAGE